MFKNKQKQITIFMGIFLLVQFGFQINASEETASWAEMWDANDENEAVRHDLAAKAEQHYALLQATAFGEPSEDSLSSNGGCSSSDYSTATEEEPFFDVDHPLFGKMLKRLTDAAKEVSLQENALRNVCFNSPPYLPFGMPVPIRVLCPDGSRAIIDENTQLRKDLGMGKYCFSFWGTPVWFKGTTQSAC